MAWSPLKAQENACIYFLNNTPSSISNLLAPLQIDQLLKDIDLNSNTNPETLNPTLDPIVYTIEDTVNVSDLKGLPLEKLSIRDRILKTDFGYAILDMDGLRDWAQLSSIIKDEQRVKEFLEKVANTEGMYPKGLTRESADWLRWTVFANKQAVLKSSGNFNLAPPTVFFELVSEIYGF